MVSDIGSLSVALLTAVSLLAGFVDSIAGGGGILMIPSLIFFGVNPQIALGTNKFASCCGTSVATFNFIKNRKVNWGIVLSGIPFTFLGAGLGTRAVLYIDNSTIGKLLFILIPLALVLVFTKKDKRENISGPSRLAQLFLVPLVCFALGFYDGFFGPGTGSLYIIAFNLLIGLGLVESSGTAKVFNLASNIVALVIFAMNGRVDYLLGVILAIANMSGNWLGSRMTIKRGQEFVKYFLLFSSLILLVSLFVKMFL